MSSTCRLDDSQITSLLEQLCDDSISSNDGSETENALLEDDIQSDVEDELVDIQEQDENVSPSQTLNTTPSDARIITVSIPTFRSKSGHCWSTSKGNSATRFALKNIVRTARGPTRQCKSFYGPWMKKRLEIPSLSKTLRSSIQVAIQNSTDSAGGSSGVPDAYPDDTNSDREGSADQPEPKKENAVVSVRQK